MLVGCGSSDETNEMATLEENIWISESCNVAYQVFSDGTKNTIFYKKVYQFTIDNQISMGENIYSDEHCSSLSEQYVLEEMDVDFMYYDLGEITVENGYIKHGMRLEVPSGPVSIDQVQKGISKDAFYAISTDRVCFSESIYAGTPYVYENKVDSNGNVYSSSYLGFYIDSSTDRTDDINYEDCLVQQ